MYHEDVVRGLLALERLQEVCNDHESSKLIEKLIIRFMYLNNEFRKQGSDPSSMVKLFRGKAIK